MFNIIDDTKHIFCFSKMKSLTGLQELKGLLFVSYVRRKKTKKVIAALLSGASVFVPQDLSLPIALNKNDMCKERSDL